MVQCKRNRSSVASATLKVVLSGGESRIGVRVIKRSRYLDPSVFHSFVLSLGVDHPSSYIKQL